MEKITALNASRNKNVSRVMSVNDGGQRELVLKRINSDWLDNESQEGLQIKESYQFLNGRNYFYCGTSSDITISVRIDDDHND